MRSNSGPLFHMCHGRLPIGAMLAKVVCETVGICTYRQAVVIGLFLTLTISVEYVSCVMGGLVGVAASHVELRGQ